MRDWYVMTAPRSRSIRRMMFDPHQISLRQPSLLRNKPAGVTRRILGGRRMRTSATIHLGW